HPRPGSGGDPRQPRTSLTPDLRPALSGVEGYAEDPGLRSTSDTGVTGNRASLLDMSIDAPMILAHNGERPWIPPAGWQPPASLLITHDYLDAPALGRNVGRAPYSPQLTAGLNWLEGGDDVINVITENMFYVGYNLYGIERCALASGYKYFGTHDWFAELSGQ